MVKIEKSRHQQQSSFEFIKQKFDYLPFSVDWFSFFLSFCCLGLFHPNFSDLLQYHVKMTVEGLHPTQQFFIVTTVYQNLRKRKTKIKCTNLFFCQVTEYIYIFLFPSGNMNLSKWLALFCFIDFIIDSLCKLSTLFIIDSLFRFSIINKLGQKKET